MMKTCRRRHEWQETFFSILGENGVKIDVNEEAWPNADLAILATYEGALIDGCPPTKSRLEMNEKSSR